MRISDWSSDVCSSDLAARVPDAAVAVDRIAGRDRMDHLPAVVVVLALQLGLVAVGQRPAQVGFADLVTVQRHLDADHGGGGVAAGEIHHHAVDGLAGHLRSEEKTSELQSLMRQSY